jgi:hypothetical protein
MVWWLRLTVQPHEGKGGGRACWDWAWPWIWRRPHDRGDSGSGKIKGGLDGGGLKGRSGSDGINIRPSPLAASSNGSGIKGGSGCSWPKSYGSCMNLFLISLFCIYFEHQITKIQFGENRCLTSRSLHA